MCIRDRNAPNHRNKLMELVERIHFYGAKASMELIGIFPEGYTVSDGCSIMAVSYTHLDVYKRQPLEKQNFKNYFRYL